LLDVSRAELGRLDLTLAPTDATAIVGRVVEATQGLARSRAIVVDGPDTLPVVWDAVRVEQILNNLVGNAVKYAPSGEVRITVDPVDDETVRITVRDHGPGIPDSTKTRLFERYFRADDGHDDGDRTDGLGIGLYISRTIARALGGELTVADAEGGGARFDLILPRDGTAGPPAGPSPSRSRATSPA
jgi:signal transduction histidine kinase